MVDAAVSEVLANQNGGDRVLGAVNAGESCWCAAAKHAARCCKRGGAWVPCGATGAVLGAVNAGEQLRGVRAHLPAASADLTSWRTRTHSHAGFNTVNRAVNLGIAAATAAALPAQLAIPMGRNIDKDAQTREGACVGVCQPCSQPTRSRGCGAFQGGQGGGRRARVRV